jgi:hypothetical protein
LGRGDEGEFSFLPNDKRILSHAHILQHRTIKGLPIQAGEMLVIVSEVKGYDWFIGAPMETGWRDGEAYDMSELMVFPKSFVRVRAMFYDFPLTRISVKT